MRHFVALASQRLRAKFQNPEARMMRLQSYPWPGNVREARNVIERALIVSN